MPMIKILKKGEGGMGKCRCDSVGGVLKHTIDVFRVSTFDAI
jgi:hypothetical protein